MAYSHSQIHKILQQTNITSYNQTYTPTPIHSNLTNVNEKLHKTYHTLLSISQILKVTQNLNLTISNISGRAHTKLGW